MARQPKKSKPVESPQPRKEVPFARWFFGNVFNLIRRFGNVFFLCLAIGYCSHEISLAFQAFSGKASLANLRFGFFADIKMVYTLSISAAGISVVLYLNERRLHRKTRERLTARITKLELEIDPTRTSSHLTSKGLTRKEDE
jgi:hypothetical protein